MSSWNFRYHSRVSNIIFCQIYRWYNRGKISVANAYLADVSSNENRTKNFGKMAISSNLGFIVGPALAAPLGSTIFGNILPVIAALILSLVTLIVIGLCLKEFKSS
jgi:MFS transporter, DHA1 family, tetracycline resistance protein